jgi:hypothetical protein
MSGVHHAEGDGHEAKPVHGRADHRDSGEQEAGAKTADVCRKYGVGGATFSKWYASAAVSTKRALGTRVPMALPQGPNQRRSLDFRSDVVADGRRVCIFAVADDFTRECLVLHELDAIVTGRGLPPMIVSDKGTELTILAALRWSQETRVGWHQFASGKPQQPASSSKAHVRANSAFDTKKNCPEVSIWSV